MGQLVFTSRVTLPKYKWLAEAVLQHRRLLVVSYVCRHPRFQTHPQCTKRGIVVRENDPTGSIEVIPPTSTTRELTNEDFGR